MTDYFLPLPPTRAIAKQIGSKHYFTGRSCPHGHLLPRLVSCKICLGCNRDNAAKHHLENRDIVLKREKSRREENREEYLARKRAWRIANKGVVNANVKRRKAIKAKRSFAGYEKELRAVYVEAAFRRENGEDVHVDHIVPLRGKNVSGLHVPWNLQIITAAENLLKGDRFEPLAETY